MAVFLPNMHQTLLLKKAVGAQEDIGSASQKLQGKANIRDVEKMNDCLVCVVSLCGCCFNESHFCNLKVVEFNFFYDKSAVSPFDVLHMFRNLEMLFVVRSNLKKLLPPEELVDFEMHRLILTKVCSLDLLYLPNLKVIWDKLLETLDHLKVKKCDSLNILTPFASFQSLKSLCIDDCGGLTSVVTCSTARSLIQLESLRVRSCSKLKVIIPEEEGGETTDEIIFRQLETLELVSLPSLTCFSSTNCPLKFSSLTEVVIKQCPQMEFFSKAALTTPPWLAGVQLTDEEDREDWLNLTIRSSYIKMAGFLGLKHLKVSEFVNLKDRWHADLPVEYFRDVQTLIVDMDMLPSHAMPPNLLLYLNNLEELEVSNCKTMEQTFDFRGLSAEKGHSNILSKLKKFQLINLPSLRDIWTEHSQGMLNFKRVTLLKVHDCSSLRIIFTPSVARGLVQLQEMEVKNCSSVEEIISNEETDEMISFPQLNSLVLDCLPKLTSFYTGTIVQCPPLEKITAVDCPEIDVFTFTLDEANSIFFGKVECSSLKELRVDWNNIVKKIWCKESVRSQFFRDLKILELKHFPIEFSALPSNFLEIISPNLEELLIDDASFEEIFSKEETINDEELSRKVTPLRRLNLSKLPQLRHLMKDQTRPSPFFENLEDLEVLECTTLTILAPSSISFQYLKTLKVSKCHGLLNLMTTSTARSLTQLTIFKVTECEMVEEIVASEGGEVEAEILFGCLNYLELHRLPKLARFCLGSETFRFPSLEGVIVRECPNLELFVRGELFTPNLEAVQIAEDGNEWCWEGSLNATIQKLFKETAKIPKGLNTEEH